MRKFLGIVFALIIIAIVAQNIHLKSNDEQGHFIAKRSMSLERRHGDDFVNGVFKDNILLNLAYLRGEVRDSSHINWGKVRGEFSYEITLKPGQSFAFHNDVLPQYQNKIAKTTNAHFNAQEGFKFSGLYFGDGVCHLASLIYWAAKDAGLEAEAPVNHSFAIIPEVPAEYGVSIYNNPGQKTANAQQNLYITNNKNKPIILRFEYQDGELEVSVS